MVVHSDSFFSAIMPFLAVLGGVIALLASLVLLAFRKLHAAKKTFVAALGGTALYILCLSAASLLTPRTIVNVGDSYCFDIWCVGIEHVSLSTPGSERLYKIDVHVFSDADHVKINAKGTSLYLLDERGRRFPLIHDPSAIPFDSILEPGQSIQTTLTFAAAPDARQLFLAGDRGVPRPFWVRLFFRHFGTDSSLFHTGAVLRVV